jgi:hypothetical protein
MSASNFSCDPVKSTPGDQRSYMTAVSIFTILKLDYHIMLLCREIFVCAHQTASEDAKSMKKLDEKEQMRDTVKHAHKTKNNIMK